jgi:flagellar hook-associated protein 3 FlgL
MISNLEPSSELFLANVDKVRRRIADANRQVSSGKRISQPADAPDDIDAVLQLSALASAINLMDRARTLATQGANSVMDAAARRSLAGEGQSLLEEMVSFSRTTVQGSYVFSGDRDDAPAYAQDAASPTGVTQLQTAVATRRIEDPAGGSFVSSKSAQEIFDARNDDGSPATDNVFAALNALQAALASGDATMVSQCVGSIQSAAARLNSIQAFYGTVQNRIRDGQDFGGRYDTELKTQLSDKEDADVAAAALELSTGNTQLQAAFQMQAAMPRKSLFDFIG